MCLAPELLGSYTDTEAIVVIIDVYRASSSICTAIHNQASALIPVERVDEAQILKSKGYIVAGERDGLILDFADFGNSPYNFSRENVEGKTVVYTTTNGTRTIHAASAYYQTIIASFLNGTAVVQYLKNCSRNVLILCSGWKGRISLEDTVCAGFLAEALLESGLYTTICDSTLVALDLWKEAKAGLREYLTKAAHRNRLKTRNLDDCIDYCLTLNILPEIPVFRNGMLVKLTMPAWTDHTQP